MTGYSVTVITNRDTPDEAGLATFFEDRENAMRAFRLACAALDAKMDIALPFWKYPPLAGVYRCYSDDKTSVSIERRE